MSLAVCLVMVDWIVDLRKDFFGLLLGNVGDQVVVGSGF
jgi:hypothetical protein